MRQRSRSAAALALAVLALGAAGCGGDEERQLLTSERGETLVELLDDAEDRFNDGDCEQLSRTLDELDQTVASIQEEVDPELRSTLTTETEQLRDLADQCQEPEEVTVTEPPPEPVEPPPTVAPEPVPTEPTEPVPTEETTEETTEEETDEEPQEPPVSPPPGNGRPDVPPGQEDKGSGSDDSGEGD